MISPYPPVYIVSGRGESGFQKAVYTFSWFYAAVQAVSLFLCKMGKKQVRHLVSVPEVRFF